MKKNYWLLELGFLGIISLIFYYFNIRICPFYRLFKIPCPGCGLTRSFVYLLKFDWQNSLRANVLGIPIFLIFFIYGFLVLFKKGKIVDGFLKRHKKIVISLSFLGLLISYYINLNY